jgi:hypothetical protein
MQALALIEAEECSGCGGWLPETTAPEATGEYVARGTRCHRCTSIDEAIDRVHRDKEPHPRALLWAAERRYVSNVPRP